VAVDASNSVIGTGYFLSTADLGGGDITVMGGVDVFLVRFTP